MAASNDFPSQSSFLSAEGPVASHYNVFLSFRGADTRLDFADALHRELKATGISCLCRDEGEIHDGEDISATSIQTIERSEVSIPIISPGYVDSKACLMELAHMTLCRKTKGHKVIPIFYLVEPSILKDFPEAMENKLGRSPKLAEIFGNCEEIIREWKATLLDLAMDPPKYHRLSKELDGPWSEFVSGVVSDVKAHLGMMEELVVTDKLVGIDHHVNEMMRKLGVVYHDGRAAELRSEEIRDGREEIRVVTIIGLGGIGKTTLAKVVFNKIHQLFEACSFLENIQESLQPLHRLKSLQQKLITDLSKQECPEISYDTCIKALKTLFKKTRVLIILDGVRDIKDVEGLAADCNWFGPGSRIILTSTVRLPKAGLVTKAQNHVLEEMAKDLAIQLFYKHAYRQNPPEPLNEYEHFTEKIIDVLSGIPAAIEAVGSFLHGKDIVIWAELLDRLKHGPHNHFPSQSSSLSAGGLAGHYKVFLSFRGPDARHHFADALCRELKAAGISCVFRDEEKIGDGEDIDATLIQAIEQSDISIPIISPGYADSKACLMELAHMSLCRKTKGQKVIPIFYLNEPSVLEGFPDALENKLGQSPKFAEIFDKCDETIKKWKEALLDLVKCKEKYHCMSKKFTRGQSIDQCASMMQDSEPTWPQYWSELFCSVVSDVQAYLRPGTISTLTGIPTGSSSLSSYDVFLSFCGSDTGRGFVDFLYHGLVDAGVHVFRDEEIPSRVDLRTELIKRSKIVIPIISHKYVSSRFLMYELVKIYVFKKKTANRSIIPIYYYVNPLHAHNCEGYFWDEICKHERSGVDRQAIELWKLALREVTNLKGFWMSNECYGEASLMKRIISTVMCELHIVREVVPRNLVGVEHHVQNILKKLDVVYDRENAGVCVVGICGRPGIGKTTLARIVYNDLCHLYCSSAFLANTGERSLSSLQEQLIWDLQKPEYTCPVNFEEGCVTLKRKFRQKRVLIVLDNVGDFEQIKALAANLHWFGHGSRIIITSKTRDVLDYYKRADTELYELGPLQSDKALELFCKHAFGEGPLREVYKSLSKSVCSAVGGLPLAIKIVGSYLKEKKIGAWKKTLNILERKPNTEAGASGESSHVLREIVKEILGDILASDEKLGKNTKEMFFDIACFLSAADERFAMRMWRSFNCCTNEGMQELRRLCFVETTEKNQLGMHELLRDIGREMAEQEDLEEHGGCRRLWNHQHKDVLSTLEVGKDVAEVEALCLTFDRNSDIHLTSEEFEGLLKLKYLRLNHADISGDFKNLLSELRWLEWQGCPGTFEVTNMHLEKLVVLDLSWSNITEDCLGWRQIQIPLLKVLNLTGCTDLLLTPKFNAFPNLEILILEHCHKLGKLDSSIVTLEHLVCLNLKFCRSLHELPDGLGRIESLEELLIDQTILKEIPGLVDEVELEALRSSSIQHSESILSQEVRAVHDPQQLKIFDRGSICIKRNSKKAYLELTGKLVGIDHHVLNIMRKLDIVNHDGRSVKQYSEDVRAVQIWGKPGAGKTTLAKVVYNKIRPLYPYCTFLEDISENAKQKGILSLQQQLLTDLQKEKYPDLKSSDEATLIIKHTFRNERVLIVLDDADSPKQIRPFIEELSWFGNGSKIIVTTRQQRSLLKDDGTGVISNYEIGQMSDDEALQLFNKHAFRGCASELDCHILSGKIFSVIGRLPLTIEVLASHLYLKRQETFALKMTLRELERMVSPSKFHKAFMVSFSSLSEDMKKIFLDIACFFIGKDKRFAEYMFEAHGSSPKVIETLCDMSLLDIGENNDLWMHGKLRNFARDVAQKESSRGSARFWIHEEAFSALRKKKVGKEIVALALEAEELLGGSDQPTKSLTCEDFLDVQNLQFLKLGSTNIHGDFKDILPNLRWLDWQGCPEILDATNLHLQSLTILELSWSKVSQDWNGWRQLEMINLKVLNLTGCTSLLATPNLSCCQCLEMLILEGCIRLVELHPSIGDLQSLVSLNLKSCSGLNTFPEKLDELGALEELLLDGTSILEIPNSIGNMKKLKILSASGCTMLNGLPDTIGELVKLRKLLLRDCCRLMKLPNSIGELGTSLKELDVSRTGISKLPDSITKLQSLRILRMNSCFITEFPCNIGKLSRLEEIHASRCMSMEGPIPSEIGKLKGLRILRLQHSKISSLPVEIQQLSSLQTLDLLHCDMLQEFPRLPSSLTDLHVNPRLWKIIRYSNTAKSIMSMVQLPQLPDRRHSDGEKITIPKQKKERNKGNKDGKDQQQPKSNPLFTKGYQAPYYHMPYYMQQPPPPYYYEPVRSVEEDPNACVIC